MSKAGVKFSEMKELLMKDKEFSDEYAKLKPRYDVISQINFKYENRNFARNPYGKNGKKKIINK